MPHVQNFANQWKDKGINVLLITLPNGAITTKPCMIAHHMTLPLLISDDRTLERFKLASAPAAYLLDNQGRVVWTDLNRTNTLPAALARLGVTITPCASK